MNIGLLDIDGHNFPNIALMKLSSWHKAHGDDVEWALPFYHYDTIYRSKIFTFSPDDMTCYNAGQVIRGGLATISKVNCLMKWNDGEALTTHFTHSTSSASSSTPVAASVIVRSASFTTKRAQYIQSSRWNSTRRENGSRCWIIISLPIPNGDQPLKIWKRTSNPSSSTG